MHWRVGRNQLVTESRIVKMRLSVVSLLHDPLTRMQLEVRVTEHAHLWTVETFDLSFFADANRRNEIAHLEPDVSHHEAKHCHHCAVYNLHDERRGARRDGEALRFGRCPRS